MQALAVVGAQIGLARLFVMPGLIAATRLHGRKDMDQARMRAALAQNLLHPLFLAEALGAANELDTQAVLDRQALGVLSQLIT